MEKEDEQEAGLSALPAALAGEHWPSLPELALHAVAMRLRSPVYFTALCGVCKSWRSVINGETVPSITADFILLFPCSTSSAAASIYSLADDAIYDCPSIPSFQTLAFFGQSNSFLLGLDDSTSLFPSVVDPISGIRFDFPSLFNSVFRFAILTAPPISPNSRLVFFEHKSLLSCPIRGSNWNLHYVPAFIDAIFFQDRLYLSHWVDEYNHNNIQVRVIEYNFQTKTNRLIFSGRKGLLVESSEGELLMVFKEQEILVGFKLLPRTQREFDGETDWPRGGERILFIGWQRSDLCISCHTGSIRKKYRIHSASPFWRNYSALSQFRSSGFYVSIDARGRAELSKIQPTWLPYRQFL